MTPHVLHYTVVGHIYSPTPHGYLSEAKYAFPGVSREYVKHVQTKNRWLPAFTAVRGILGAGKLSGVCVRGAAACCDSSHAHGCCNSHDAHLASAS